jgi:thioredoxin reductase/NAD-dependent dihydropyrimidine dehydrogenase PreA subunit
MDSLSNVFSWEFIIYAAVFLMIGVILTIYILKLFRESKKSDHKIKIARQDGLHEPVSLYPVINPDRCISSGACVKACPEHDILGLKNGRATIINASQCIGHGACLRACPTHAISLWIGTEKRGVDLPNVSPDFESNVPGIYIAGELGGMGLIKNAIIQGKEAVDNLSKLIDKNRKTAYDLVIVGAGPAGISASLQARKSGLKAVIIEQESLGGTVFTYPRSKIVMTSPVELPLYGKLKFRDTSKTELLEIWNDALSKNKIEVREKTKALSVTRKENIFEVETSTGDILTTQTVLLAIGRRGTPRKLNVPGEISEKVAYRLLEPEDISGKKIMVVGGGDSAIESALLLADNNIVTISYRGDKFTRLKPANAAKILEAIEYKKVNVLFQTEVTSIEKDRIKLNYLSEEENLIIENDFIYIFAGGEMPVDFLKKSGIHTTTKKGEVFVPSPGRSGKSK